MIAWMLYAALVAVLIAAGALALERLVASAGRPRRFVWLAALTLAVVVPLWGGLREAQMPQVFPTAGSTEATTLVETVGAQSRPDFIPPQPIPPTRTAARTVGIAWAAGSAVALGALCAVLVAVARARRRWPRARVDGTEVYLSRRFGPALIGLVAPKPVIPRWVLRAGPAAQAAILRHELEHARARDNLALLYVGGVLVLFPWSPAIWWICRRLRAAIEIDCDQRVVQGGIGTADYSEVLLEAGSRSHGGWGLEPAMGRPKSLLETRLRTMIEERLRLKPVHGALLAAAAMVTAGIACEIRAPTSLDEAIDQVMADRRDDSSDAGTARLTGPYLRIASAFHAGHPAGTPPPVVFVDGRRLSGPSGAPESMGSDPGIPEEPTGPPYIMSVEILKGSAAQEFLGEEAPGGVVEIFTSRGEQVPRSLDLDRVLAEVESQGANPGALGWSYSVSGYERRDWVRTAHEKETTGAAVGETEPGKEPR